MTHSFIKRNIKDRHEITNVILMKRVKSNKKTTVCYYDPKCYRCGGIIPIARTKARKYRVGLKLFNTTIEPTSSHNKNDLPIFVHYNKGGEISRLEGKFTNNNLDMFFKNTKRTKNKRVDAK